MTRFVRMISLAAALCATACMKGSPAGPSGNQAALRVRFQNGTPGQQIRVQISATIPDSEVGGPALLDQTYPSVSNAKEITAVFDLTPCLALGVRDEAGPVCYIQTVVSLLDQGAVIDQHFLGLMPVRPGETVHTDPVVLVAGANPPVITAFDTGRLVEAGLIRYHLTASDPDGDLTEIFATSAFDSAVDRNTALDFFPPLRSYDATTYAFASPALGANELQVFVSDSKFNSSALDTVPVLGRDGDAFVDSMSVDTTADSVVFNVLDTSDSVEFVLRNLDDGRIDSLYFSCGGSLPVQNSGDIRRFACGRPTPFTDAVAFAVPIDPIGRAGQALRCAVPAATCTVPLAASRIAASRRRRR